MAAAAPVAPPPAPSVVPAPIAVASAPAKPQSLWGFLWPSLAPYKWMLLGAILLNALSGTAVTVQNLMPKYLIDDVINAQQLSDQQRWHLLIWLVIGYLVTTVFCRMLAWHASYRLFTRVREKVLFSLRTRFFKHVNHLCLRFHLKHHSGELYSYLFGSPLGQIQNYLQQCAMFAPSNIFTLVSTLVWIGGWDYLLSMVLFTTVFANVLVMRLAQKRVRELTTEFQQTETSVTGYVADLLRGTRDVKLYAMEDKVAADFETRVWEIGQKSYRRDVQTHVEWMKNEGVGYLCFAVMCIAVVWRYTWDMHHKPPEQRITLGQIQAYLTAFMLLQGPMNFLFNLSTARAQADAGLARIQAVLSTASTTPDPVGYEAPVPPKGDILLYNVHFSYLPERPILKDISLTIPYGQKVALVGPSGSGKSTITQLLLRLYDPDQGAILIGGLNIRHCRGPELRHRFGVVPQDPFMFRTNIRENLRVGRPEATDAEIQKACELANAWEFIAAQPKGLDTPVGEGGATLSGGQRQRLAIARALLADPDYFIFDEATSALDTVSERLVQDAMERAINGRTALIIAHRLATVKNCDRILVLQDGQVAQDGTYDELVNKDGLFRDLVRGQQLKG